jgi:hypothetical protein
MSNHRKHLSEIPLRKTSGRSGKELIIPPLDLGTEKHRRFESEIPANPKIATTCMTERVTNSDRAYNYTEIDALKEKVALSDVQLEYKTTHHKRRGSKDSPRKSAVFSELKRTYMDDDNEGLPNYLLFLKEPLRKETDPEDEYTTKGYFTKIKVDELVSTILTVNTILVCVIYYEIRKLPPDQVKNQIVVTLAMISVASLFLGKEHFNILVVTSIFRYINHFKLYRSARYITIKESFFNTDLWKYAIFDISTSIIHPNLIANGKCLLISRLYVND